MRMKFLFLIGTTLVGVASCFSRSEKLRSSSSGIGGIGGIGGISGGISGISGISGCCLNAVRKRETAFVDGAEWASLQHAMNLKQFTKVGALTIVTGTTTDSGQQIIALEVPPTTTTTQIDDDTTVSLDSSCYVWKDSIATLPNSINDDLAISTYIAAITGVHCALPRGIAGCPDQIAVGSKIVVMGGGHFAQFIAKALAELGAIVSLVSNTNVNLRCPNVSILSPEVDNKPFCEYIGEFDALIDTLGNERREMETANTATTFRSQNRVIDLLLAQHNCKSYLSTLTESQRIMSNDGVLFGPGKVKDHIKSLKGTPLAEPPKNIGASIETLLSKGITYQFDLPVRTWSLSQVWEEASWPEDSSSITLRYGLPGIDDIQLLEEEEEEEANSGFSMTAASSSGGNPFVKNIAGVNQFTREIVLQEKNCLLFLSAKYCRTCRNMGPGYTRMARINSEKDNVVFATTDTTSEVGKQVARSFDVEAVPAFVLFREGKQFGTLSITKLPSKKLDMALEWLESGEEWNFNAVQALEKEENENK